jgi:hypothetical protein
VLLGVAIAARSNSVAYSLPSVLSAFYPYYMLGLAGLMPYAYTPVVLLVAGDLFLVVGSYLSKDLRHVDLANA